MDISKYLEVKNKIPANVNLLAVSKGFKSEEIRIINSLGQIDFGESKFQEGYEKQQILKDLNEIRWHFIGRIQSNKIRKIVKNFQYIHSVDSYNKLTKIANISLEEKKNTSIFLQVKLSDDPTKGGFDSIELKDKWEEIMQLKSVDIKGLMTINPKGLSSSENIPADLENFRKTFGKCLYVFNSV